MDTTCKVEGGKESGNPIVVILVGAPGSGKSTFCDHVMLPSNLRPWVRICQDTIKDGKSGTKNQCLQMANMALKKGKSVFIDRCNLQKEQRAEFVQLGNSQVDIHAVVLDLPARLCISRSVKRDSHEGNLQGGKAALVVNRMLQTKELPKISEGFFRITYCQTESEVQNAVNAYVNLSLFESLPSGYYGQNVPDAKAQLGIMKFFKKEEIQNDKTSQDSIPKEGSKLGPIPLDDIPTLAFPSISTSCFQFDINKASDIIVEKAKEFINNLENVRLVLVDLSHESKILSLVKSKAIQENLDPRKFFTFVGDITQLYTEKGLRCQVLANAANWRLKPGGGGVNSAIYTAAGPGLDTATMERSKSLLPGESLIVPLPLTSPLHIKEGVTHIIHVLGPNMNPQRSNFLNHDYIEGCKVLRRAYSSLFEAFATLLKPSTDRKKRDAPHDAFVSEDREAKKINVSHGAVYPVFVSDTTMKGFHERNELYKETKGGGNAQSLTVKSWASWAQALYRIAMHPEEHANEVLEVVDDDVVVINDLYPKARRHVLVVARLDGLDCLADVRKEHLPLLRKMHDAGVKWVQKFLHEDASFPFRLGYHSDPSMRQLHLHVISQDFDSIRMKHRKHWNTFNTPFFRDSSDVISEVALFGKSKLEKEQESKELRCHRCGSAHPNMPRLKSHINNCSAPFPFPQRLVFAQEG